jgi:hypothetical protein
MLAVKTEERINGETPKGGVYSIAYFQDANGQPVAKEDATSIEIIEFDENDRQIWRTYMRNKPYVAKKDRADPLED